MLNEYTNLYMILYINFKGELDFGYADKGF